MTTQSTTEMPSVGYGAVILRTIKSIGLLKESWVGMIGAFLVLFWVLVAVFAPLITQFDPNAAIQPFAKPGTVAASGGTFWLGTDHVGLGVPGTLLESRINGKLSRLAQHIVAGHRREAHSELSWWKRTESHLQPASANFRAGLHTRMGAHTIQTGSYRAAFSA